MLESDAQAELARAAAPTFAEISGLAAAASPRIAAMLLYIRDHLFDRQLTVKAVKTACSLRDNSTAIYFHREVGKAPGRFITDSRLAVAERLLRGTWLPLWRITDLLGYSSIQVFGRAYYRRNGRRPSHTRRLAPPLEPWQEKANPEAPTVSETEHLSRALAGQLPGPEAADLIIRLLRIYLSREPPRAADV